MSNQTTDEKDTSDVEGTQRDKQKIGEGMNG